jgi:hypothetical protein
MRTERTDLSQITLEPQQAASADRVQAAVQAIQEALGADLGKLTVYPPLQRGSVGPALRTEPRSVWRRFTGRAD